ncbi:epoxyqueuosine reductase [Geomesophilobacter sediminis]|uniref:Epoxyqueuosine reductase n=1 Tax=Geomesophilobacter sediminis TaxID=2798584 RepID=A0A8J7LY94_9BACT|nr:epoxyqueuosine reductase [Geomesophilobacter sediminis]MBJ6724342.1 epoxyqueuosine reductase [Geomesophilobacter sediminis]
MSEKAAPSAYSINEIPKWGEPYPRILNRESVLEALTDYILQVNHQGYRPNPRKVLAVRTSDRTATLRSEGTPIRQEVYYRVEGEVVPWSGATRLKEGQTPAQLAEELLAKRYEQLWIWVAYDFTKGSPPGFRKPFETPLQHKGSAAPNPDQVTRRREIPSKMNPRFFLPDPVSVYQEQPEPNPDLALEEVHRLVSDLVRTDFRNVLPEGDNPPIWDLPLVGVAAAEDPIFARFQDPEVVGAQHRLPEEWLPGARSIVSVYLPFSEAIAEAYRKDSRYSAIEFSSGKWNGSKFLNVVRRALVRFFEERGGGAVAPNIDPRYDSDGWLPFWSERHAAFAAGLGTFGLQQALITERGAFGRVLSVITTLKLTPTPRPYTEVYGYCLYALDGSCRACVRRCPTGAVNEAGKLVELCSKHGNSDHFQEWGYGSCGHCSTFIPCSHGIPDKIRKRAEDHNSSPLRA